MAYLQDLRIFDAKKVPVEFIEAGKTDKYLQLLRELENKRNDYDRIADSCVSLRWEIQELLKYVDVRNFWTNALIVESKSKELVDLAGMYQEAKSLYDEATENIKKLVDEVCDNQDLPF